MEAHPAPGRKKKKKSSWFERILFLVSLAVFIFCAVKLGGILLRYRQSAKEYTAISDDAQVILQEIIDEEIPEETFAEGMDEAAVKAAQAALQKRRAAAFYARMQQKNPDYIGWIRIADTRIDYPVTRGVDNSYYLTHTFDKTTNASGSIFADNRIGDTLDAQHQILYGHNMKDGSMFAGLKKLREEEFYQGHKTFEVFTETGFYTYEIVSVYVTDPDSDTYTGSFANAEEFLAYAGKVQKRSMYPSERTITEKDCLLTLSTCVNNNEDRLVIQAVRLEN